MFETLKGRIPKSIDEDEYRKFAVMVALLKQEDGLLSSKNVQAD